MHATAPVFTHSHAEPGTSWLTTNATMRRHTAAARNRIAHALVLTFLLAWAVRGVFVGADPTSGRALIRFNSTSVRAPTRGIRLASLSQRLRSSLPPPSFGAVSINVIFP